MMADALNIERRHSLVIKIGADTWEDMRQALDNIAFDLATHEPGTINITSGGPTYGYVVVDRLDTAMTHDLYFEIINDWIERERAARREAEASPGPTQGGDQDGHGVRMCVRCGEYVADHDGHICTKCFNGSGAYVSEEVADHIAREIELPAARPAQEDADAC